jgi:hypothetical protein
MSSRNCECRTAASLTKPWSDVLGLGITGDESGVAKEVSESEDVSSCRRVVVDCSWKVCNSCALLFKLSSTRCPLRNTCAYLSLADSVCFGVRGTVRVDPVPCVVEEPPACGGVEEAC